MSHLTPLALVFLIWLVHICYKQSIGKRDIIVQFSSVLSQIWSLVSTVEENLPRTELIRTRWTCLLEVFDTLNMNVLQDICKKTSKKDVTPFDVQDQRLDGTEAEKFKV